MHKTTPTDLSALRISPKYTSTDWQTLDQQSQADWPKAAAILKDRLDGRFLRFATDCLNADEYSGFVVLSIDCLLVETIQQFKDGIADGHGLSEVMIKKFLQGERFQPDFLTAKARRAFYTDIRCGLLHQAEAKNKWLIRRKRATLLERVAPGGYIIDVELFHAAVRDSLEDYLTDICRPDRADVRENLWTKMNAICNVRAARGALYEGTT
jgi:hypothetical protein